MARHVRGIKSWLFRVYVALNMLVVSVLPWSRPRETISGMVGRFQDDIGVVEIIARIINRIYFWEDDHCRYVARCEAKARMELDYEC